MYDVRFKSHHDAQRNLKSYYYDDSIDKESYVKEVLEKGNNHKKVIYIHVPFCNKICSFCPFNKPDELKRKDYHMYVIDQLKTLKDYPYFKDGIDAINFGGGTPTAIRPDQMDQILTYLKENFKYKDDIEISVESSITELTNEMLDVLVKGGVNRLSIGVQSFNDDLRKLLNRRGDHNRVINKLRYVLTKIPNTSVDLIYNIPGEDKERLMYDINQIIDLNLAGISFYSLMIHPKTPLGKRITKEELLWIEDLDREYEYFNMIMDNLLKDGYEPLELTKLIHNKRDRYYYMDVRHHMGDCIAIGHGAGGNIGNYVYRNTCTYPNMDFAAVGKMGRILKDEYFVLDDMIYSMQKNDISFEDYDKRLGFRIEDVLDELLNEFEDEGMIIRNKNSFKLTRLGFFYGNNIIQDLINKIVEKREIKDYE